MAFAFVSRWLGWRETPPATVVELSCGGRVAVAESENGLTLAVTTAPDANGEVHFATVPLSVAERLELGQVLDVEKPLAS
ncbi:hypothetical protein [Amycolatopsis sp. NPDC059657]|uniref:hypothetical protein n=1 Tax=Amycolatopsis sp. NPDC059657 TaxID=3346899 RepID=UPI00366BEC66